MSEKMDCKCSNIIVVKNIIVTFHLLIEEEATEKSHEFKFDLRYCIIWTVLFEIGKGWFHSEKVFEEKLWKDRWNQSSSIIDTLGHHSSDCLELSKFICAVALSMW